MWWLHGGQPGSTGFEVLEGRPRDYHLPMDSGDPLSSRNWEDVYEVCGRKRETWIRQGSTLQRHRWARQAVESVTLSRVALEEARLGALDFPEVTGQ